MGIIYAICGGSGVGKTTLLNAFYATKPSKIRPLFRTTDRSIRPNEKDGVDYIYLSTNDFLAQVFMNSFIHVESYENHLYGIETGQIESTIASCEDGIIVSGTFGALKLKAVYGSNIVIIYVHTGSRESLSNFECLEEFAECNQEIIRRLKGKLANGIFTEGDRQSQKDEEFLKSRMKLNYLDIALINGKLKAGEKIEIIENIKDQVEGAVQQFYEILSNTN